MPVSNNYHVVEYEGNNSGRSFNFPFRCFSLEHLVVELVTLEEVGVEKVEVVNELIPNSDYSVCGGLGNNGGSVTYPLLPETPALAPMEKIRIYRKTPLSQDIDYPTYQQAIENALDKAVMINQEVAEGSEGATQAIADFAVRINDAESTVTAAVDSANSATLTAEEALTTARMASGNASIALDIAGEAESKADQAVESMIQAVEDVDYAVDKVNSKVDADGSNIDKIPFLSALGVGELGEIDLRELANTTGSNIDTVAFKSKLGLPDNILNEIDSLKSDVDEINTGMVDLANTLGSNISVVDYKTALAPRFITSLSGVTGNYVGEQILRISGVEEDPDDDMYFWDGNVWRKEGI